MQLVGTPEFPGNLLANGQVMTAPASMIVRDSYTTIAYFLHERVWTGIKWGVEPRKENCYMAIFYLF